MARMILLLLEIVCMFFSCCIPRGEGLCAFPCTRANRTYDSIPPGVTLSFSFDLTRVTRPDGTYLFCWERSRQFFVQAEEIDGERFYQCIYDPLFDKTQTLRVMYVTPWIKSAINPTICDICNGTFMEQPFFALDKECRVAPICNIPAICPITDPTTQIRCTGCEPSEAADDGICCGDQTQQP